MTTPTYTWKFPLTRPQAGIPMGNGGFGAMVWGRDNVVCISLNRADFRDERGGAPFRPEMAHANLKSLLEHKDEEALFDMFAPEGGGKTRGPAALPLGRVEILLPEGHLLQEAALNVRSGEVQVTAGVDYSQYNLLLNISMDQALLNLRFPARIRPAGVRRVSAHELQGSELEKRGMPPPLSFDEGSITGWIQGRPAGGPVCVAYHLTGADLWVTVVAGEGPAEAKSFAKNAIDTATREGLEKLRDDNDEWWHGYWRRLPRIDIPNERLGFMYHYGMYKLAGLAHPDGPAATLQGPWVHEYQPPSPGLSAYRFDGPLEMIYSASFRADSPDHLKPLLRLLDRWEDTLRENARLFLGIEDGLLLPRWADAHGLAVGRDWTGAIDPFPTAWTAALLYRHYQHTGDKEFLRRRAFPFMAGAMRVYEELLVQAGDSFHLPLSVSPKYRGTALHAFGPDASAQLAAVHFLCRSLIQASEVLGKEPRYQWVKISRGLPEAGLVAGKTPQGEEVREIGIWEGVPLEKSHRCHSHLAGIHPFDVIDVSDDRWKPVLSRTLRTWIDKGPGRWSALSFPWAALIHARVGNGAAAEALLEIWERLFTNEGHGNLQDPLFPGLSLHGSDPGGPPPLEKGEGEAPPTMPEGRQADDPVFHERLRLDAGLAAAAAVLEMLVQVRSGVHYLFAGAPVRWEYAAFEKLRTEGAFLVGASRGGGEVARVQVRSDTGGTFRLRNPWKGEAELHRPGLAPGRLGGEVLEVVFEPGEQAELRPVRD